MMKTLSTLLLAMVAALALACGYSSKKYPPTMAAMPAISQLSPDSASAGGPPFTLTVNGSSFGSTAVVNWNGTAQASTVYISGNQLMVSIPAALIANSGTVQITVTNPGTSGTARYGMGGTTASTSAPMNFMIN